MSTPTGKIFPPALPPWYVARPALDERLGEARVRRVTTVVAGAGFGKTTLLSAWAQGVPSVWYTVDGRDGSVAVFGRGLVDAVRLRVPGLPTEVLRAAEGSAGPDVDERSRSVAFAALLCEALEAEAARDLILILDDLQEIGPASPSMAVVEGLCRQAPAALHLVLSGRTAIPFPLSRLRGRGLVVDLEASSLAFSPEEVRAMVDLTLGVADDGTAARLHEVTEGWPAAVRLALERLRTLPRGRWAEAVRDLDTPRGPLFPYLAEEVFASEPPAHRELVGRTAVLERFSPALCEAIGIEGAAATIGALADRGLFFQALGGEERWYSLTPLIRDFALDRLSPEPEVRRDLQRRAAEWLGSHGHLQEALRALVAAGDARAVADFLESHGGALIAAGAVEGVVEAASMLDDGIRTATVNQLEGEARQVRGDWDGALACFHRAAGGADRLPAALAWRMGLIHHFRGELDEALAVYALGRLEDGQARDEALLLAWTASLHWLRGERDRCHDLAMEAFERATASGDPQALAAAHTALAMLAALDGDRRANDAHYLRALDAAERAGDVLQIIRIRTNRASHFNDEGAHREALRELDIAITLAEVVGFTAFLGLALTNRAQARLQQGSLEEALADFEASRVAYQRIGSRMVCYPLAGIGDVYRRRGDVALARAAYEEALSLAQRAEDVQGLVPSKAGLARVLVTEDPQAALALAEEAAAAGPGMGQVAALVAVGWAAIAAGDRQRAAAAAAEAASTARRRRDRVGLAEALALEALSDPDPPSRLDLLHEARSVWKAIGDPLGEAEALVAVGRLSGGSDGAVLVERGERRLRDIGVRLEGPAAGGVLATVGLGRPPPLSIRTLGGFGVLRHGRPVPLSEWQSRKARDLLKMLVARRGHPVPREAVMETLWPEEDPGPLANRLSVALTTVRSVLDPDRRMPGDHFVGSDKESLWLELGHVDVDIERFLTQAGTALRDLRSGRPEEALPALRDAEAMYVGDFLEENAYDEWAVPLREEGRATYLEVVRLLARQAAAEADHDAAVRYHLRVIERDPYDEQAHLGLAAVLEDAGRHGEASRRYRTYQARMQELGVEPASFPRAGG